MSSAQLPNLDAPAEPSPRRRYSLSVTHTRSRTCRMRATGELDLAAAADLTAMLDQQCAAGCCFARLDLSGVSFLDCGALGVLIGAHHRFLDAHGTLTLTGISPPIARLLALTDLDQTLFWTAAAPDPLTPNADPQDRNHVPELGRPAPAAQTVAEPSAPSLEQPSLEQPSLEQSSEHARRTGGESVRHAASSARTTPARASSRMSQVHG